MWVDNMVEPKPLLRFSVFLIALLAYLTASVPAMSYEEPEYSVIKKTDVYEVRKYQKRTVAEVSYGEEDSGFRVLFDYISGANKGSKEVEMTIPVTQSKEIDMTVPVTQSTTDGKMSMRFFLPKQYSKTAILFPICNFCYRPILVLTNFINICFFDDKVFWFFI